MRKIGILPCGLTILLMIAATGYFTNQVKGNSTRPKILFIGTSHQAFATGVSAYGETTSISRSEANLYTVDQLREFDLFATQDAEGWGDYPDLVSKIGTLIDEGKSLIVLKANYDSRFLSPTSAWVSGFQAFLPTHLGPVEYEIVSSNLTHGVRSIKTGVGSMGPLLYGGYPLVLSPDMTGFPDPQGALAVHGSHGYGKYAVLSGVLFAPDMASGDITALFSNIMYWLTNREFPGQPLSSLDTRAPTISILSPEDETYTESNVPLIFAVDESTFLMSYSLDGQAQIVIDGNTTLTGLSEGYHSLTVHAKDFAGNTGSSLLVYFAIETATLTEPFQLTLEGIIITVLVAVVIAETIGFVLYRRRKT